MDSYLDIKALPDSEIIQSAIIAHLMQALHGLLPNYEGRIGLDFPAYGQQRTLGGIIRVLGNKADIQNLYQRIRTSALFSDYAFTTEILDIPRHLSKHVKYQRYHVKGNSRFNRLKKRHIALGTWTQELAKGASSKFDVPIKLPHISIQSTSTGQNFMLFVKQKTLSEPQHGAFNTYGLSLGIATVPKF